MADARAQTRLRKAWRVSIADYDDTGLYFAPDRTKARLACFHEADGDIPYLDISAKRSPSEDQRLPTRHPLADELTDREQKAMLHAFGFDEYRPWKAGYRDHYYTSRADPVLCSLQSKGMMVAGKKDTWGDGQTYFRLTDLGKAVALSLIPEYAL